MAFSSNDHRPAWRPLAAVPGVLSWLSTSALPTLPIIDYHVVYALVLVVLAATTSSAVWGLARWWSELPFVKANTWLR